MKHLTLILVFSICYLHVFPQMLAKRNVIIMSQAGISNQKIETTFENDTATIGLSGMVGISGQYFLSNKISINVQSNREGYYTSNLDSSSSYSYSMQIGANFVQNITNRHAMYLGACMGPSNFTFVPNDTKSAQNGLKLLSKGSNLALKLGGIYFLSNKLGLNYEFFGLRKRFKNNKVYDYSSTPKVQNWQDDKGTEETLDDSDVQLHMLGFGLNVGIIFKW